MCGDDTSCARAAGNRRFRAGRAFRKVRLSGTVLLHRRKRGDDYREQDLLPYDTCHPVPYGGTRIYVWWSVTTPLRSASACSLSWNLSFERRHARRPDVATVRCGEFQK